MLIAALTATGLAVLIAIVQTFLRNASRPNRNSLRHGLTKEDLLFWTDWLLAGVVCLVGQQIVSNSNMQLTEQRLLIGTFVIIVLGFAFLPSVVRFFVYNSDGSLRSGFAGLIIADASGLILMISAVIIGAQVYDFG